MPPPSIERINHYVLVDDKPVPEPDLLKWGAFMESVAGRTVRQDFFVYRSMNLFEIPAETYRATVQRRTSFREATAEEDVENAEARRVREELGGVPIMISTVFLGLDHNWAPIGPPILWETMAFGIDMQEFGTARYASLEEARSGHAEIVSALFEHAKRGLLRLGKAGENLLS